MKLGVHRIACNLVAVGLLAGLVFNCTLVEESEPLFNNPLDPEDERFIPPETYIVEGPAEDAVIDDHTVTFSWTGNEGVSEYSYRLYEPGVETGDEWTGWSADTEVTFTYLNDAPYVFEVAGRYHEQAEDQSPDSRSFTIDDIHGPALAFDPRKNTQQVGATFSNYLTAIDVTDLMAVYAEIGYDANSLRLDGYEVLDGTGDFLRINNGDVLDIIETDPTAGSIRISLSLVDGNPPGVSAGGGAGLLIRLDFRILINATTEITLSPDCKLINSNLEDIPINELVNGVVEVVP